MAKIKIISNPYKKRIKYEIWNNGWQEITRSTNPRSLLLGRDMTEGFFPFKAKSIADAVIQEYRSDDDAVHIEFEGPEDEFCELQTVFADGAYDGIATLACGSRWVANARDILPEIKEEFKGIESLLQESFSEDSTIKRDYDKFIDASSDVIPLCVLGNYSAGKSTFINALIGHELLPNGDEPVTAKVYQIKRSRQRDRAHIRFYHHDERVDLHFDSGGLRLAVSLDSAAPALEEKLAEGRSERSMIGDMNRALAIINDYERDTEEEMLSDLIEIEVPFSLRDPWGQFNEYVIFDTPGSNSASNEQHLQVLRKAMQGLSNGLPVYVCEKNSLDTEDNVRLYEEVSKIDAIDGRFAMIVVNKADAADLPAAGLSATEMKRVMASAVPKRLYAQGIYFVSSILGLGAKTGGVFESDNYAEKFEDQQRKYTNPNERFYKMLYRYNIQPDHLHKRAVEQSEACNDLLLANSGLFAVERDIDLFAERYSVYNKCQQSCQFLNAAIEATGQVLRDVNDRLEEARAVRREALERDKQELVQTLEEESEAFSFASCEQYPACMDEAVEVDRWCTEVSYLQEQWREILERQESEEQLETHRQASDEAFRAVFENVFAAVSEAIEHRSLDVFGDLPETFKTDVAHGKSQASQLRNVKSKVVQQTFSELVAQTFEEFEQGKLDAKETIDEASRTYWEDQTAVAREKLVDIVTNSSALPAEKQQELANIIMQYQPIDFSHDDDGKDVFAQAKLAQGRNLLARLFPTTGTLETKKLARTYNGRMEELVEGYREALQSSHRASFEVWLSDLRETLISNIDDYNPVLREHSEEIREDSRRIAEVSKKIDRLRDCLRRIAAMMEWRGDPDRTGCEGIACAAADRQAVRDGN